MLAVAAATLFYAIAGVFTRRQLNRRAIVRAADGSLRPPTPLETALGSSLVAGLVATTLAVVLERPPDGLLAVPASGEGWLAVLWLGVLGTGLAYLLHFRILERWGPTRASLVTYVIPLVAVTLGFVVLGERLEPLELVGAALIIGGVVLVNGSVGQRPLFGPGSRSGSRPRGRVVAAGAAAWQRASRRTVGCETGSAIDRQRPDGQAPDSAGHARSAQAAARPAVAGASAGPHGLSGTWPSMTGLGCGRRPAAGGLDRSAPVLASADGRPERSGIRPTRPPPWRLGSSAGSHGRPGLDAAMRALPCEGATRTRAAHGRDQRLRVPLVDPALLRAGQGQPEAAGRLLGAPAGRRAQQHLLPSAGPSRRGALASPHAAPLPLLPQGPEERQLAGLDAGRGRQRR